MKKKIRAAKICRGQAEIVDSDVSLYNALQYLRYHENPRPGL